MARRCSSCSKFCSVELNSGSDPDLTISDARTDGVTVNATGDLELESQCCSDTVATASVEDEVEIAFEHADGCKAASGEEEPEYDVEGQGEFSEDNRYEGSGRWMKTFYAVSGEVTAKCEKCEAEAVGTVRLEEQASGFEEY